jgi:hypothetical protein
MTRQHRPAILPCRIFTWNLPRNRTANFSLGVFQQLDESGNKVSVDNLFIDGFGNLPLVSLSHVSNAAWLYLFESVCHHVAHSPALVLE